jgi:nucleoside-diphosphate-sugar epimerase
VDDAATGFTALATLDRAEGAYHLGGHSSSMLELGREIAASTSAHGIELRPKEVPESAVFPLLDDTRARKDFGFSPRYTDVHLAAESLAARQGPDDETETHR